MDRDINIGRVRTRAEPWDIVVIGGGATGVGCTLDAASRGYAVLLVEQHDLGKGTSSRSTKLIHGGVRYLRQGNISLVREALHERALLLRNAPHVVHTMEFVVPCYGFFQKIFYGLGLKAYDLLAGEKRIGRSRIMSRQETIERLPTIKQAGLSGGVLYHDGQFDDTRLLIDMAVTADAYGACLLNYARVDSFIFDRDKVAGVNFTDQVSGESLSVKGLAVINATGVFCDDIRRLSDLDARATTTFAQGSHIVLDRKFLPSDAAVMIPKTSDGRVLFCIPWHGHVLVGTTDTLVDKAVLEPHALDAEIDFILATAGEYLTHRPTRDDILSAFAGIRPLVNRVRTTNTASLSRGHEMFVDGHGLVTITGGKWTTYRRMAEEAVNKAIDVGGMESRKCTTEQLTIPPPAPASGDLLHPDLPYTQGDIVRAVRVEMAQTVEDVLARRTRALFLNAAAAIEIAPLTAEIMAAELGKDTIWYGEQVQSFTDLAYGYLLKGEV